MRILTSSTVKPRTTFAVLSFDPSLTTAISHVYCCFFKNSTTARNVWGNRFSSLYAGMTTERYGGALFISTVYHTLKWMDKIPLVVGNWKMELSHKAAVEVLSAMKKLMHGKAYPVEVVVCPSYPSLSAVYEGMKGTPIAIGAQNVHHEEKGAYTGSVAVGSLRDFITWCILGHSEVRREHGDDDVRIAQKASLLLSHGIRPIICIGETKEQRDDDSAISVISNQLDVLLARLDRVSLLKSVIAYEPIWAIGSGVLPEPNEVYEVLLFIRKRIAARFDIELADRVHLIYGGSVQGDNVREYIAGPGADGVLVGGASTHPRDFVDIVTRVAEAYVV